MSALPCPVAAEAPRVLHAVPGRLRVHLPEWSGREQRRLETSLHAVDGVRSARANPLTGNVVIEFDPRPGQQERILTALSELRAPSSAPAASPPPVPDSPPPVQHERYGKTRRARIAVRGLDRNPRLARRVEEHLMRLPGVRARANPLTGRVLVELAEESLALEDLIADIGGLELPPLPDEDRPTHPLDRGPLVRSATRTIGAGIGLAALSGRRFVGVSGPIGGGTRPAEVAAVVGLLQSFPVVRNGLRRLLGPTVADVLFGAAGAATLTLAGSPAGLAVTAVEGLRVATEAIARREAWRRYEDAEREAPSTSPGAVIRLHGDERTPRPAVVRDGVGTAIGRDGLPLPAVPGAIVPAGARLFGGPFALELLETEPFEPAARSLPVAPSLYERYLTGAGLASFGYAALTGLATRSFARTLEALLLVNPRTAMVGAETAEVGASARMLRAGVTVVGTRPERRLRRPDVLLIDGARVVSDGFEVGAVLPLGAATPSEILAVASAVAQAAGSPWGRLFTESKTPGADGVFDGRSARAAVEGASYVLGPPEGGRRIRGADRLRRRGAHVLVLRRDGEDQPLGLIEVLPRLAPDLTDLIETCRCHDVAIKIIAGEGDVAATEALARRANLTLAPQRDALAATHEQQERGARVAFLGDGAEAAPGFAACDLAIGLGDGRSAFPARADLLAPDLGGVAAIVEACARRDLAVRDAVGFSIASNVAGAAWGVLGRPSVARATTGFYASVLGALALGWLRLAGGKRTPSALSRIADPHPERWGRQSLEEVLRVFGTTADGLTGAEAASRLGAPAATGERRVLLGTLLDQVRSPLIGILAAGAGLSLVMGSALDVVLIGGVIVTNVAIGAWQERQAGRAVEALAQMGSATARVIRDGEVVTVPASRVVPGDVVVLSAGDRVAADARVLAAQGLEVDEAALTGESLPVAKMAGDGDETARIVLEGSDVVAGSGRVVVVAVGAKTRLGATAAALGLAGEPASPLGLRLGRMLRMVMPVAVAGGAVVAGAGVLRGQPWLQPLALGTSIAVAAVPEGLPLLARMGEAAVARRLSGRQALVRRLGAVEALGRVDVACTDKTGTLTEGRLALHLVADAAEEADPAATLPPALQRVLLTGALASPPPNGAEANAHPTDVAVVNGALTHGFEHRLLVEREAESPFAPGRSFHAVIADARLCIKGAPEVIVDRCDRVRRGGDEEPLDAAGRRALLERAHHFAEQGLRVLMVAEGSPDDSPEDPRGLVALGFLGISDPLKPAVRAAVRQCREAGVRVIMLTGDHPATARAIAREAGVLDGGELMTATEIAELNAEQLAERLERVAVIARATPLDKVRIVESLQRHGHAVAMTGDGANDGPALRLADAGIAMGRGTEVARQAADVVLVDDDFSTLVQALVEGRVFWRNIRRALSLLLGGNLGELGLLVAPSVLGLPHPLNTRQILAVNLISDVLPALSLTLQPPGHGRLAGLAREGTSALERPLRLDIVRRGIATAAPSLAAYLLALGSGSAPQAAGVAFASIVTTQLAQTLDLGWSEGRPSASILGAVAASGGLLALACAAPPVQALLGLTAPTPAGWLLIGGAALGAVLLSRLLDVVQTYWNDRAAGPAPAPAPVRGAVALA
jgi:calcium-translocating P-type ATPase